MHPGNHVKLPFPDNCVFIRAIIYKVLKMNQTLCPAFALNCFKPLHQYCQSYHPHFIKKQMQKGSDLPRFTQLTHCIARIQARYVYLQSPCSSLPIRMGAEQPNIREKGWGDTEKVVKNSIRSRSLLSLHQDAKRSGSRYFFGSWLPLFSILDALNGLLPEGDTRKGMYTRSFRHPQKVYICHTYS